MKSSAKMPGVDLVVLTVVPRPTTSASPGTLSEMQVLRSYLIPTESEAIGMGSSYQGSARPPGDFDVLRFENQILKQRSSFSPTPTLKLIFKTLISFQDNCLKHIVWGLFFCLSLN